VTPAATFAAYLLALLVAHKVADHWIQTDTQACGKGARGRAGAFACARHVATYTAATSGFGFLVIAVLHLPVTLVAFLAGQGISAITHYWADRRFTLAWLCRILRKGKYYAKGGAYELDQSWHWLWLFVAALVTVVLSS
jgi:putative flippase GtrA